MRFFVLALLLAYPLAGYAQGRDAADSCYVIRFLSKKSGSGSQELGPNYQPAGFYLTVNQVFDVYVNGRAYFYSLILKVEADRFLIATNWESTDSGDKIYDTLSIVPTQKIILRMLSIDAGYGGVPHITSSKDYGVSIVRTSKYCFAPLVPFETAKARYRTHQYFTMYPDKLIRIQNRRAYFIDEMGESPLAPKMGPSANRRKD